MTLGVKGLSLFILDLGSTQPRAQWVPGEKQPTEETDHSHHTLKKIKNVRNLTSTSTYVPMD